jgi:hypothetical protein
MPLSAFADKAAMPDGDALAAMLGERKKTWDRVISEASSMCADAGREWKFYSKQAGWTLLIKNGKRTLAYLIPLNGSFKINFVFGGKAEVAAEAEGFPARIAKAISDAPKHMEGRSFMIDINEDPDADVAMRLIAIKNNS